MQKEETNRLTTSKVVLAMTASFILGIVWFVAMRVALYQSDADHFHANFAIYINGQRELFEEVSFYEEVSSCGSEEDNPLSRVHMHDQVADVVHVHDASATWGNFFENLGFVLGDNVLYARNKTYVDGQGGQLRFWLNGQPVVSIAGKKILSEDKLLISFAQNDEQMQQQYDEIASTAAEYNTKADPSACTGSDDGSLSDRLRAVLGL